MRFNFSELILDMDNQPIPNRKDPNNPRESAPPLSLAVLCVNALLDFNPRDAAQMAGEEKMKRFNLAQKLYNGGWQDVTAEEIVMLKEAINRVAGPLLVGRAFTILEAPVTEKVEATKDANV